MPTIARKNKFTRDFGQIDQNIAMAPWEKTFMMTLTIARTEKLETGHCSNLTFPGLVQPK
jgi:hypothetical protein